MITKTISEDEKFCTHESDTYKIKKVGTEEIYSSATDLNPCEFEYKETDLLLDKNIEDDNIKDDNIEDAEIIEDNNIPE